MNIGVLGGTFDPIHNGHLHIATETQKIFGLSKIYFVVAQTPPHKCNDHISSPYHRFAMVSLALESFPNYLASTIELEQGASPFTIDTLRELCRRSNASPHSIFFLAGGDSFQYIQNWKDYEELLTTYNVIFIDRPDFRIGGGPFRLPEVICERIEDLRALGRDASPSSDVRTGLQKESKVYLMELGAPRLSSSELRRRYQMGRSSNQLVPRVVDHYLKKHRLYMT